MARASSTSTCTCSPAARSAGRRAEGRTAALTLHDFTRRALGAARLDPAIYEEVEHDAGATSQALAIVLLAGVSWAVGLGTFRPAALVAGMIGTVFSWGVWAGLCLVVGTRLLPQAQTRSDAGELLRVLGFAAAPGMANVLGLFAPIRTPIMFLVQIWMVLAMIVAVRQALDYTSTGRAIAVCAVGWVLQMVLMFALFTALGPALAPESVAPHRASDAMPTAGYVGVVKPSGVAPPVE